MAVLRLYAPDVVSAGEERRRAPPLEPRPARPCRPEKADGGGGGVRVAAAWLVAIVVGWTITTALMAVLIGFLLVPVMIVVTLAPFVQASYEAYMAYMGEGRRYV